MTKSKSKAAGPTVFSPPKPKTAAEKAAIAEHRAQLLASVGATEESTTIPDVKRIRKRAVKKPKMAKQIDSPVHDAENAESLHAGADADADVEREIARNVATAGAKRKRKSEATTDAGAQELAQNADSECDDVTKDTDTQPASKKVKVEKAATSKPASKKRKAATDDATLSPDGQDEATGDAAPPAKKRVKRTPKLKVAVLDDDDEDATTAATKKPSPPRKKPSAKASATSPDNNTTTTNSPRVDALQARINIIAHTQELASFHNMVGPTYDPLRHDPEAPHILIVPFDLYKRTFKHMWAIFTPNATPTDDQQEGTELLDDWTVRYDTSVRNLLEIAAHAAIVAQDIVCWEGMCLFQKYTEMLWGREKMTSIDSGMLSEEDAASMWPDMDWREQLRVKVAAAHEYEEKQFLKFARMAFARKDSVVVTGSVEEKEAPRKDSGAVVQADEGFPSEENQDGHAAEEGEGESRQARDGSTEDMPPADLHGDVDAGRDEHNGLDRATEDAPATPVDGGDDTGADERSDHAGITTPAAQIDKVSHDPEGRKAS